MQPSKFFTIEQLKEKRVQIDALMEFFKDEQETGSEGVHVEDFMLHSVAGYQVLTKLIESKMWVGKMIEAMGQPLPPQFADKSTTAGSPAAEAPSTAAPQPHP